MTKIMNYSTTSTSVALGFFIHLDHPLSKLSFELKLIINFSFLDKIRLMHLFWCFAPLLNRWWNTWKAFEVPQRFVPQLMPLLPSLFAVLTFMSVTWNEGTLPYPEFRSLIPQHCPREICSYWFTTTSYPNHLSYIGCFQLCIVSIQLFPQLLNLPHE